MFILLLSVWLHPPTLALPEIAPPLPQLSAIDAFPDSAMCDRQLSFLSARRQWLDNLHDLYRQPIYAEWFSTAMADVNRRREAWYCLECARGCNDTAGGVHRARCYLADLRALLGARDFEAGVLPSLVGPTFWRRAD